MKSQGKTLNNTEKMKVDEHLLVLIKKDCTNKFSIPKSFENTLSHNFNVTHGQTNNYQVTITFMEKLGNSLNNTEKTKVEGQGLFEFWKWFSIKQIACSKWI